MKHTSTPWSIVPASESRGWRGPAIEAEYGLLAEIWHEEMNSGERTLANAAFIVRACNSHDDLLAALKMSFKYICGEGSDEEIAQARAAIAKAEQS